MRTILILAILINLSCTNKSMDHTTNLEKACFGAGCFWGVESTFEELEGVIQTRVGYMGGHTTHPSYQQVCSDTSGHAEVVYIEFDPAIISYAKLLEVFWKSHNPTMLNRQGPDFGTQYRSVIFYYTENQKLEAQKSKEALEKSGKYKEPVVTQIVKAEKFWLAEEYHQKYYTKKGIKKQCGINY